MRAKGLGLCVLLGLSLLAMGGCGTTEDDGEQAANGESGAQKAPVNANKAVAEALPELGENYHYNPIGKRDPFRSPIEKTNSRDLSVVPPLQKYDLDQYQLRGIIWSAQGGEPMAMVEDPTGQGHVIYTGTIIGKSWGTVTQIKDDEVIVTEEIQDTFEDRLITNEFALKLIPPDTEKGGSKKAMK